MGTKIDLSQIKDGDREAQLLSSVDTLAELKAVTTTSFSGGERRDRSESSAGDGLQSDYIFRSGDQSANVAADTNGEWVVPDDRTGDGSDGAWQRITPMYIPSVSTKRWLDAGSVNAGKQSQNIFSDLNDAIGEAYERGTTALFSGTWDTTEKVLVGNGRTLMGAGHLELNDIVSDNVGEPVVQLEGAVTAGNFKARYDSSLAADIEANLYGTATAVAFRGLRNSMLYPIAAVNASYGFRLLQETGELDPAGKSSFFQNTCLYLRAGSCYLRPVELDSYNTQSTGNFIANLRINCERSNGTKITTADALEFREVAGTNIGLLNIEHGEFTSSPLRSISGFGLNIGHLHFEDVVLKTNNTGLVQSGSGQITIEHMNMLETQLDAGVAGHIALVFDDSSVKINNLHEQTTALGAGAVMNIGRSTSTTKHRNQSIEFNFVESLSGNITEDFTASNSANKSFIKRWGLATKEGAYRHGGDVTFVSVDADFTHVYETHGTRFVVSATLTANRNFNLDTTVEQGKEFTVRNANGTYNIIVQDGVSFTETLLPGEFVTVQKTAASYVKVGGGV